jgi:hypothetical protein
MSDWELQKEMVAVDMKANNTAPIYGKCALGFDDNNVDFILGKTTQGTQPTKDITINIFIDKDHSAGGVPDVNDFVVICGYDIVDKKKKYFLDLGMRNGWAAYQPLTFPADNDFVKSYFSQDEENYLFAVQIPNSFIGPGGPGGLYGWAASMDEDFATVSPGYPPTGDGDTPSTWSSFTTAEPIPEFPGQLIILSLPLILAYARKRRIDRKKQNHFSSQLTPEYAKM